VHPSELVNRKKVPSGCGDEQVPQALLSRLAYTRRVPGATARCARSATSTGRSGWISAASASSSLRVRTVPPRSRSRSASAHSLSSNRTEPNRTEPNRIGLRA
jgi:hypothetical protein